jgi:FMN phosphatase YigB (HAD superfamily)
MSETRGSPSTASAPSWTGATAYSDVLAESLNKPVHNHFAYFEKSLGVTRDRWVHAAQSYFHDLVPASELGITCVWNLAVTVSEAHRKVNG